MSLQTHSMTIDVSKILGTEVDTESVRAWIESSVGVDGVVADRDNHRLLLGDEPILFDDNGQAIVSGIIGFSNSSDDVSPTGLTYRVWLTWPGSRVRKVNTWNSGWLTIDADVYLDEAVDDAYMPPTFQGQFMEDAQAYLDAMELLRAETEALRDAAAGYLVAELDIQDGQVSLLLDLPNSDTRASAIQLVDDEFMPFVLMGVI